MKNQPKPATAHTSSAQKGGTYILRIATVLLAIVSWWATAQGMTNYVFSTQWQAYLASLAIQAILLGLNFYLPTFWRYSSSDWSRWGLGILSAVVLFCSSWFSYVYIVERAYQESWDTTSRLLVQSSYREELYGAADYIEEYDEALRDVLSSQVVSLHSQAAQAEQGETQSDSNAQPDFSRDRIDYASNTDFAASREVNSAIQVVEDALQENASASGLDTAVSQIADLQAQIDQQIASLNESIAQNDRDIATATENERLAQTRLNNAQDGTNTVYLSNALTSARQRLSTLQENAVELQQDLSDYQTAQRLLQQYAGYLSRSSIGTSIQVTASLRNIQSGLLGGEVDAAGIEEEAKRIFEQLQASKDTLRADDSTYESMLDELDSLIRNTQKYAEIKAAEQTLNALVNELQNSASAGGNWKNTWTKKLETLKSVIGGLPSYTGPDSLTLRGYSRTGSMDRLDDTLRKYISSHNAADQALIYLFNPYYALAWFSLLLAFFLDISAFIIGFILDIADRRQGRRTIKSNLYIDSSGSDQDAGSAQDEVFPVPSTAQRYAYLTGDFTKEGGQYFYEAYEGSERTELEISEQLLQPGFYVETAGQFSPVIPQELALLRTPNGPRDGVYQNCCLQYSDHMLCMKDSPTEEYRYLATMEDTVPVYQLRKNECVCLDVQDIPPQPLAVAILALNSKGTQVAALYLA